MIIKNRKYLITSGVMFYPELEMTILKKQALQGWKFVRMTSFGVLVFKKGCPEEKQFAVDFYDGEKNDIPDYLALYEEAGWKAIYNYRKKYFYFEAPLNASPIYTDPQSYRERIYKEWSWAVFRSLITFPIGIAMIYLLIITRQETGTPLSNEWIRFFLYFFGFLFAFWPVGMIVNVLFSRLTYGKRIEFYKEPEKFAKKQRKIRDVIILMIIGGFMGGCISFLMIHLLGNLL